MIDFQISYTMATNKIDRKHRKASVIYKRRRASFLQVRFCVVFDCRSDQGRDTCRNSANGSIVSQRSPYQRHFYLRSMFRQLQRLLGPAYPKSETSKRILARFKAFLNSAGQECPTYFEKLRLAAGAVV